MTDTPSTRPQMGGELLPCPFCGGDGYPFIQINDGAPYARCSYCGTQTARYASSEKAISAWNRRASLPQPPAGSTDEKPPVAPDGWCPRCETKVKYHGGEESHSCGALLVAAPDSCFPAGWLREEMQRASERVRQWREAASTSLHREIHERAKAAKEAK